MSCLVSLSLQDAQPATRGQSATAFELCASEGRNKDVTGQPQPHQQSRRQRLPDGHCQPKLKSSLRRLSVFLRQCPFLFKHVLKYEYLEWPASASTLV